MERGKRRRMGEEYEKRKSEGGSLVQMERREKERDKGKKGEWRD